MSSRWTQLACLVSAIFAKIVVSSSAVGNIMRKEIRRHRSVRNAFKSHTSWHDIKRSLNHSSKISEALNYVFQTSETLRVHAMPWRFQNSMLQLLSSHFPATISPNKSQRTVCVTALLTSCFAVAPKCKPCQSKHHSVGKPEWKSVENWRCWNHEESLLDRILSQHLG